MAGGRSIEREAENYDFPGAPPMPTTSIYSRSDGVFGCKASFQAPSATNAQTENIELRASHLGLGFDASAWRAVADRLALPEGS